MNSKILIVTSKIPFLYGGNELLAECLADQLKMRDHQAEVVFLPHNAFSSHWKSYLATRFFRYDAELLKNIDRVIALKFPSWLFPHKNLVVWFNHPIREYYDLWDLHLHNLKNKKYSGLHFIKEKTRKFTYHAIDKFYLARAAKIFAQSVTVQKRIKDWFGLSAEVLYPPGIIQAAGKPKYGNYFLAVGRLEPLKRIDLIIEAFAKISAEDYFLFLVGNGSLYVKIQEKIHNYKNPKNIKLLGQVSEKKLTQLYQNCSAVISTPYQEDCGLVAIEAMKNAKSVVTCYDSGGVAELVQDGKNGFISAPEPACLANFLERFLKDQNLAKNLGREAFNSVQEITWDKVIAKLLS